MRSGWGSQPLDTSNLRRARRRASVVAAATAMILGLTVQSGGAHAQVIEILPDGGATAYAGPVQTVDGVARPIAPPAPPSSVRTSTAATSVAGAVQDASARSKLSAALIEAVAWQESRMKQSAVSPKGARGVMQLMPAAAARLGVDPADLSGNVNGGAAYLAELLKEFDGDIVLSLAAYNAGPAAVRRWGGVPPYPETRAYVAAVLDRLSQVAPKP